MSVPEKVYTCQCGGIFWLIDAPVLQCRSCDRRYFVTESMASVAKFNAATDKAAKAARCPPKPNPDRQSPAKE